MVNITWWSVLVSTCTCILKIDKIATTVNLIWLNNMLLCHFPTVTLNYIHILIVRDLALFLYIYLTSIQKVTGLLKKYVPMCLFCECKFVNMKKHAVPEQTIGTWNITSNQQPTDHQQFLLVIIFCVAVGASTETQSSLYKCIRKQIF